MIAAVIMQRNITGIINCCTGKPVSLGERVEQFIKECNLRIELEYGAFLSDHMILPVYMGIHRKFRR